MTRNKPGEDKSKLVSFKISSELYKQLEKYSETQQDEAGLKLSPSQAARRLMLDGLRKIGKTNLGKG